jgi:hypothetical protein
MHLGRNVALTPSVFAYSMLYPYTDNYLDAVDVDARRKRDANERLLLRLNGISVPARNRHEKTIDRLVCMIENEFNRNDYPQVFEILLAIHKAQIMSVSQCDGTNLTPDQLLDISIEKGGTSVLADGYLVAGVLSEVDREFFFRFGVLLQLIDDLQDLEEDRSCGQQTLVGFMAAQESLHSFTNDLLSYLAAVVGPCAGDQSVERQRLRALIERSCRLLIFEAIAVNQSRYSEQYLAMMQPHSPVRFEYLKSVQQRLQDTYTPDRMKGTDKVGTTRKLARRHILELVR